MIKFSKYSATGNDFIVINNLDLTFDSNQSELWKKLCMRRRAIGADGVLIVEPSSQYDFRMRYFNSDDGIEAEMCGNGARAIVHFFHQISGRKKAEYQFETMNSEYLGKIIDNNLVSVQMSEVFDENRYDLTEFDEYKSSYYINTGVPHLVLEVDNVEQIDAFRLGRDYRHNPKFEDGVNVNFIQRVSDHKIKIRTYERGVENLTLSCGTGITASVLSVISKYGWHEKIEVEADGGTLNVCTSQDRNEIYLIGEVHEIYQGIVHS